MFEYGDTPEYVLAGFIGLIVIIVGAVVVNEIAWAKTPSFQHEGILLSQNFTPARSGTGIGTGVGSNGQVGTMVVSTHESSKSVTLWDLGTLGKVSCEDEEVFRWAQPKSILLIKQREDAIRIVGIVR